MNISNLNQDDKINTNLATYTTNSKLLYHVSKHNNSIPQIRHDTKMTPRIFQNPDHEVVAVDTSTWEIILQ